MRFNPGVHSLLAAALLLAPIACIAQEEQAAEGDLAGQLQVQVIKTTLVDYSSTKLVIGLTLAASSKRSVTLEQVVLSGLRLNGLPLYAAPVKQRLELRNGITTLVPGQLPVTIYLHDLDSVAPLRDAVSTGHATLDGAAYATVRLSPLAKVMLLTRHAELAMKIHQEVPFSIPGGNFASTATLKVLDATDKAMRAISSTVSSGRNWASAFRQEMVKTYAPHSMLAYSRYDLRDADGDTTTAEWTGVALIAAPGLLVTPREAIEPWKFDHEVADALRSKRLTLVDGTYDLWVWPAGATVLNAANQLNGETALRLSKEQLAIVTLPGEDHRKVLTLPESGRPRKTPLENRKSSSNLATIAMTGPNQNAEALKIASSPSETEWGTVALFRFRDGIRGRSADAEMVLVPARRKGERIELGEMVDSAAFGSPMVSADGVIGIVQDEDSGVSWTEATRVLKVEQK